ncbi:RICIN domain-containing protein [Sorangium sp. So ce1153]|uniref:RICIN domain-containing protein n=1 Tax=unclassified Sorangium TaxID=2621164 RepID=UPI003F60941D
MRIQRLSPILIPSLTFLHLGCVMTPATTEADTETDDTTLAAVTAGTTYALVRKGVGKCIDVASAGTADGTPIQQWTCNGTGAQSFRVESTSGGAFRLVNTNSGKCIDVASAGVADGTPIQQWTCNGTGAQSFYIDALAGGYARLRNTRSGKCVDIAGNGTADGTKVQLWTCNGTDAQSFTFQARGGSASTGAGGTGGEGGAGGAGAIQPTELGVMTFNLRVSIPGDGVNYWPNRRDMVYRVIRDATVDVIGVQEALRSQLDDLHGALPYSELGVGRDDGMGAGEYSAILYSADRFEVGESGTFWLSDTPEVPGSRSWGNFYVRICTWARLVERSSGRGFYVFNTHLDHESQPSRARSVELIADRIAKRTHPDPVIFTGDFNVGESNLAVLYVKGDAPRASGGSAPVPAPPGFVDTFRVLYPSATEVGTFNGFRGDKTGAKIDFIFANPTPVVEVLEAQIIHTSRDGLYPSDHFPVTARLRLAP